MISNISGSQRVTFETKCYEKDWQSLICKGQIEKMIDHCNYEFEKRVLYINNVSDYKKVKKAADKLVGRKIIDRYVIVKELADFALETLGIDGNSFNGGYYYSIAELVSIYLCTTDYLLHFSGDSLIEKINKDWISSAISLFEKENRIIVANPLWDNKYDEAKRESFEEDDNWWYSYGFSDQCYLIKAKMFQSKIYNESNKLSNRYPAYGGELFEKRVDSYLRNHNYVRITNKQVSYFHQNIKINQNHRNYNRLMTFCKQKVEHLFK